MKTMALVLVGISVGAIVTSHGFVAAQQPSFQAASPLLLREYEAVANDFRALLLAQNGLRLMPGEDIRDVTAFLLNSAAARSGIQILDPRLRDRLRTEFFAEAVIWCWLPTVPPDLKESNRSQLQAIRRQLLTGAYARDIISLASGTSRSIGEQVIVLAAVQNAPEPLPKMAWAAFRREKLTSSQLLQLLRQRDITYDSLLNIGLLRQYLRVP